MITHSRTRSMIAEMQPEAAREALASLNDTIEPEPVETIDPDSPKAFHRELLANGPAVEEIAEEEPAKPAKKSK